jgi:hypothetical protein
MVRESCSWQCPSRWNCAMAVLTSVRSRSSQKDTDQVAFVSDLNAFPNYSCEYSSRDCNIPSLSRLCTDVMYYLQSVLTKTFDHHTVFKTTTEWIWKQRWNEQGRCVVMVTTVAT